MAGRRHYGCGYASTVSTWRRYYRSSPQWTWLAYWGNWSAQVGMPDRRTRTAPDCPYRPAMETYVSASGVWRVDVREVRGLLHGEVRHHDLIVWQGWLTAGLIHAELDAVLAERGAPPLEQMARR